MSIQSSEPSLSENWQKWQILDVGPEEWTIQPDEQATETAATSCRQIGFTGDRVKVECCRDSEIVIKLVDRTITIPVVVCRKLEIYEDGAISPG